MDSLEKERERKEIQYDIFSGFLAGLSETEELPVDFNEKLFHRLVDYATVYPDGKVVFTFRNDVGSWDGDLKPTAAGASGLCQIPPATFFCVEK